MILNLIATKKLHFHSFYPTIETRIQLKTFQLGKININVVVLLVLRNDLNSILVLLLQERLESRIIELEAALEAAQKTELKDKQALTKLQKQLSRVSIEVKGGLVGISCISC